MHRFNFTNTSLHVSLASWIIFGIVIFTGFFGYQHKASAVWGIGDVPVDVSNLGPNISSSISEGGSFGSIIADLAKEIGLDTLAYVMGQQIGEQLVNKFTSWATGGGYEDNPLFIQDQKSFMNEIKDIEILKIVSDIDSAGNSGSGYDWENFSNTGGGESSGSTSGDGGGNTGSFSSSDQSVVTSIVDGEKKTLEEKLEPTMDDDERENFSNDFAMGGWDAWEKLGRPENNPIGREKIITDEYTKRLAESQEAAQREAEQNDGYMGQKECLEQRDNSIFGNYDFSNYGYQVNTGATRQDADCAQQTTTTPGGVAAHTTEESTTFNFDSIASIDEISEVASNALGAMITGLINEGLSEIGSGTSTSQGTGLITSIGNTSTTPTNSGSIDWLSTPKQAVDMRLELPEAIRNAGVAIRYLEKTIEIHERRFQRVKDLDMVTPGPDFGWQDRLKKYFDQSILGLMTSVATDGTGDGNANNGQGDDEFIQNKRFNEIKLHFAEAIQNTVAAMNSDRYRVFNNAEHIAITDYINQLPKFGEEYVRSKDQLVELRNIFARLIAIKSEIGRAVRPNDYLSLSHGVFNETTGEWEGATYSGVFNETTGEWEGATWLGLTADEWKAWEELGTNEDGSTQTDPNGTPVQTVIDRNRLLQQFIAVKPDVPVLNLLERIKSAHANAEYSFKHMGELLAYAEQFWADNYQVTPAGNEDFGYWTALYTQFLPYASFNSEVRPFTEIAIHDGFNLVHAPGLINTDDVAGPWKQAEPVVPPNWLSSLFNYPSSNPKGYGLPPNIPSNQKMQEYVDAGPGVLARRLREIDGQNVVTGNRMRAYSVSVTVQTHMGIDQSVPWNVLRRDREQRLFCGFGHWPTNMLSANSNNYMRDYDGIFCSGGWYRARDIDYNKAFRPDMAQLYSQL